MEQLIEKMEHDMGYKLKCTNLIYNSNFRRQMKLWSVLLIIIFLALLFLPWTQNIRATGTVTTLYQDQRPQELNALIPGRIVKWHVKEGDYVKKGDTIVQLADVKVEYLDTNLVKRTEQQLNAKQQKIDYYGEKIDATSSQIIAMESVRELKISSLRNKINQLRRKVQSDSAEWQSAVIDLNIAKEQYNRAQKLFKDGIISLVDFERRTGSYQKAVAAETEKQNKFQNTKQDLTIAAIDINSVQQETADKVFKARGEQASAQSEISAEVGEIAKLENLVQNYRIRGGQRWLIAPQNGQVTSALKAGLNEIVKEGELIVKIVPTNVKHAVEIFVKPVDQVLVDTGQKIMFLFDGYPAIVFSGWPQASYGSFSGKVIAVETNTSSNGLYRVLVVEDKYQKPWPAQLKMGNGAIGFALLKDVPIWYELWRNINGFPAEYYIAKDTEKEKKK